MQTFEARSELQRHVDGLRAAGRRVALVPTMGALHAGHLSLIAAARKHAEVVCVSIFVNPTQFDAAQDFEGYPRALAADLERCRAEGVDLVYAPEPSDLYPDDAQTWVDVERLTEPLCGASRPGHFRGVTTIVAKLLLAAKPHVAVFGQKDFQQVAVVRRMVRDLGFDVEVLAEPTVREPDGLALSSRNVRLGPVARAQATVLVEALEESAARTAAGERAHDVLLGHVRECIGKASLARIDYAELRDPVSLAPSPSTLAGPTLLALAVEFEKDPDGGGAPVRLIDNRVLLDH